MKHVEDEFMHLQQGTKMIQKYTIGFNEKGLICSSSSEHRSQEDGSLYLGTYQKIHEFVQMNSYVLLASW